VFFNSLKGVECFFFKSNFPISLVPSHSFVKMNCATVSSKR
jgi:hypothetical protein